MTDEKKKMTAQGSSVGADDGQSISQITENSRSLTPGTKSESERRGFLSADNLRKIHGYLRKN